MTAQDCLAELFDRLACADNGRALFRADELRVWPAETVATLKEKKLLVRATPAKSVVCPGCEEGCSRDVFSRTTPTGQTTSFVVCDRRSDTSRVTIAADSLRQWQCRVNDLANFVADALSIRYSGKKPADQPWIEIGTCRGDKRAQLLCLGTGRTLELLVGSGRLPLVEVVAFYNGALLIDDTLVRQLVDSSTTGDPRYTPSTARREVRKLGTQERNEQWRNEYRNLKQKHPGKPDTWYARKIAKMEIGDKRAVDTIRKNMK